MSVAGAPSRAAWYATLAGDPPSIAPSSKTSQRSSPKATIADLPAPRGRPKAAPAMGIDVFDIVAVILGVIFTIRKLDAQRREPEEFPHVKRADFLAWRTQETRVYLLGMMACFSKVLAKVLIAQLLAPRLPYSTLRWLGASVDLSWLVLIVITMVGAVRMGRRKIALRIVLGGLVVSDGLALGADL